MKRTTGQLVQIGTGDEAFKAFVPAPLPPERPLKMTTAAGSQPFKIHTPLIRLTKAQIIRRGVELGVDYSLTVSCYSADDAGRACGRCDACRFRREGFAAAGVRDPTRYRLGA